MSALFKFSIFVVLAVAIGVYVYRPSLFDEYLTFAHPTREALRAGVAVTPAPPGAEAPGAPMTAAAQADFADDLDYMVARKLGSLNGWRAFLDAHGNGPHAQSARAEIEKLRHAKEAPATAAAEASNGASPDAATRIEAAPPAAPAAVSEAAPSTDEICKSDEERLERLRASPSSEEAARFDDALRCEKLRPQLLALMSSLGPLAPAPAVAKVSNDAPPDAKTTIRTATPAAPAAAAEAARSALAPAAVEGANGVSRDARTATEAGPAAASEAAPTAPAPAAAVAASASPDAKSTIEAAPRIGTAAASETASSAPDDMCKGDVERMERLRGSPSSDEAARFAKALRCERLRPQLLRLMESLGYATAAASASTSGTSAPGLKAVGDCVAEQDTLDRIRAQPSADAAQAFWQDLQCERLRPQVRLLLESLNIAAEPVACKKEADQLARIRTNPDRRDAESFARGVTCDALKPQAARLLESLAD